MYKVDLHTHSVASPDGGLSLDQYRKVLDDGLLDAIAITDHNRIDWALNAQKQLGSAIIVGEEIMTNQGEVVGLFLSSPVRPHMSLSETIAAIKSQNGLVYIPHPFETVRKGLHPADLENIVESVDILEVCNGRAFAQNKASKALVWAKLNNIPGFASSDAHGYRGLGKTYTNLSAMPSRDNLLEQLQKANMITDRPGIRALLYPKYHRLRKKLGIKYE